MYSTKLNDNRFVVRCIRVAKDIKAVKLIVDTGAQFSCVNYSLIDGSIQEKDFDGCDAKVIRGLIEGESVKLYKYRLR